MEPTPNVAEEGVNFDRQPQAPRLAQHNTEVLAEIGYSAEQIAELACSAVITPG